MNLDKASEIVWSECMNLKEGENALIVCDKPLRTIGSTLFEKAVELGGEAFFLEMIPRQIHGEEPPSMVADVMKSADVIVIPTSTSLSHTKARREACAKGARIATLPNITEDIMMRAIPVDYEEIKKRSEAIANLLNSADAAYLTTEKGTDLTLPLKGMKAEPDFGLYHKRGDFGNLPAGEAYIAPLEGVSEGTLIVDGAIAGIGKLEEVVTITVVNGMAKTIENCPELEKMLDEHGERARNIAELGVGTNDKATVVGNILEDEKVMGTVHVALGNNVLFGGTVDVPIHLDCIVLHPTLEIDGELVIENGELLV
ncbi:MAG: aminopeptidase [Theionarchaea archaeon]|nr:MAG: leucyl aminopeptidase [Theionarchaea archaeon DG-70-1]MBU7026837.1 aminopeptidase [Theionarchaea archaeon]